MPQTFSLDLVVAVDCSNKMSLFVNFLLY